MKAAMGIDIGSISTKGVIIDEASRVLAHEYILTEGNPIGAVKKLLKALKTQWGAQDGDIVGVGVTGSARKLIGVVLEATIVKNEITAHAIGTTSLYPDVRTILEIGGQDSKIILIENGILSDYAMNTLCAAGTGAFLSSQSQRLGLHVEEFGAVALKSQRPTNLAARCTVFAESDLIHKAQMGHKKEDIVAGLCKAVVANYLNNVGKGKRITPPIVFQGGVSKNAGVVKAFEEAIRHPIIVDPNSHLMGALGVAILARRNRCDNAFAFDVADIFFETKGVDCTKCANNCEILCVFREGALIDAWGNRCDNGTVSAPT